MLTTRIPLVLCARLVDFSAVMILQTMPTTQAEKCNHLNAWRGKTGSGVSSVSSHEAQAQPNRRNSQTVASIVITCLPARVAVRVQCALYPTF